jgi:hypothetical protein
MTTVRVYNSPSGVRFEIIDPKGSTVARSIEYRTICKLEDGLRSLYKISARFETVVINNSGGMTLLSSNAIRCRLNLSTVTSIDQFSQELKCIPNAQVRDDRDQSRKRTNLSGPLKSLL